MASLAQKTDAIQQAIGFKGLGFGGDESLNPSPN